MAAALISLCEDIQRTLEGAAATLPLAVTVARAYMPNYDIEQLADPVITIVPRARRDEQRLTRSGSFQYLVDVDIAVQEHLPADTTADTTRRQRRADELLALVESVLDVISLRTRQLDSGAYFQQAQIDPIFAPEHWQGKNTFTAIITATYLLIRS